MREIKISQRLYSLDLLKFILSLIIVFHHFQQTTGTVFSRYNFFYGRIQFGFIVEFFFIISGFATAMGIEKIKRQSFVNYITNKIIRIYPMVIISVLAETVLLFIYRIIVGEWWEDLIPSIWRIFNSLALSFSGGAINNVGLGVNNPIWYLCVLMICYIIVWIVVEKFKNVKNIPIVFIFSFISLLGIGILHYGVNIPFLNYATGRGYASFFWGMVLFYIYQEFEDKKIYLISYILLIICLLAAKVDFSLYLEPQMEVFTFILFPSIFFSFLSIDKYLKSTLWGKLGEISFEVYLWHVFGITILCLVNRINGNVWKYTRVHMFLFTLLIIIWSILLHFMVEKPLTKYCKEKYLKSDNL